MAHHEEPMDVDSVDSDFDNKENTYHHSNVLPCTEKGYEELDVSELNMKLRYSITPAASPMSKSYTAYIDNKNLDCDESLNCINENANLTRSLNSTMTKNDSVIKSLKTLPLQTISTEQISDNRGSVLRQLDSAMTGDDNNVTITNSEANDINENLSLPSSSSSAIHTPEATTPTNTKNEEGSPIIRGLKSVFNMFRSSQSPIPPVENDNLVKQDVGPLDETYCEDPKPQTLASTPISAHRSRDGSSKRSSPLKDSIVFNDDLEKELQWKDDTILFNVEKIPIHKLLMPQNKPASTIATPQKDQKPSEDLDMTVKYMDVSQNHSMMDNILTETHSNSNAIESDSEFVDCETTFTKNEQNVDSKEEIQNPLSETLEVLDVTQVYENVYKIENAIENKFTLAAETHNITKETVVVHSAVNKTIESKESHNMPPSDAVTLDVTRDDDYDTVENINITKEEIQEKPYGAVESLDIKKESVIENDNLESDAEIIVKPAEDSTKTFDVTTEIQDKKVPTACGVPESVINPLINEVFEEGDVLPPKLIAFSTEIPLDQNADSVQLPTIIPNVEYNISHSEPTKESITIENINDSNDINKVDKTFKTEHEKGLNITQVIDETTAGMDGTLNVILDTNVLLPEKIENKLQEDARKDVEAETNYTEQNLLLGPSKDEANDTIKISLPSPSEDNVKSEEQAQLPNDLNAVPKETSINDLKEPANIPLPDNDDLDIDMKLNKDNLETIQAMPPDVIDTVKAESKLDVTETLNEILNNKDVTGELSGLPSSEMQHTLNETNEIVNSLTEIIGDNDTVVHSESMLDQSQSSAMEGVEFTEEIQKLPDLVNQTIHNMSVDCEIIPETTSQSQTGSNTETVIANCSIDQKLSAPNVPEIISDVTEEKKTIIGTLNEITIVQSNESINTDKEHTDTIVVNEGIDVAPEISLGELKDNENETALKEEKILDVDANEVPIPNVDEELVLSENNSPYVSVIAETESKAIDEGFENIDIPINTKLEAPSSPPIRSKGYNFNFDEMDDPFATKTKVRQSPPPTTSELNEPERTQTGKNETGASKKMPSNRRRSQPAERKKLAVNKKKFNTTFDASSVSNLTNNVSKDQNSEGDLKNVSCGIKNTTVTMDNKVDIEIAMTLDSTQVLDKIFEDNFEVTSENDLFNVQLEEKATSATSISVMCEISSDNKSLTESMSTAMNEVKTSSSEQSTYYSAAASSSDSSVSKNVFNLPEIGDKNFNPFATKSKMRQSPPLDFEHDNPFATKSKIRTSPDSSIVLVKTEKTQLFTENIAKKDAEDKIHSELMEKDSSYNVNNTASSSSSKDTNITTREVNTEDEDTEEGPFLEAEDAIDKLLDIDNDMMQFNEIPAQASDENAEGGELFIDAEAFEFLLNQNKSNVVADSGKESLFLKFDPLFAKRISSDGVLAALNKVQKRQSTPTKPFRPSLRNEASPIPGPSALNTTNDEESNVSQDSIDEMNITVAKPMMVVTPAVNPAVTPRNRTTTPPRSNRRSITFTSPAMAVIDRLLSLSGNNNNSLLVQDSTITQSREHIEADLALSQLRELLAEKEISVYQLRSESKELKDRLSTMESQMKILEADGKERLNKINELNDRLAEKTKVNKSMAAVVEEYERTIASLIAETEQDKKRHAEERIRLINERDEQTAHLASMEVSFSDLHSKYERSKQVILSCKANEDTYKKSIKDFEENLAKMQTNYEMLKQHATSKLNHANQELQKINKAHENEYLKLNALIKRKDMHITSLEETLAQKTKANLELTAICDELINKVG